MNHSADVQRDIDQLVSLHPCAGERHFPFFIAESGNETSAILYGNVRIDGRGPWDGGGGRTDLHDVLGLMWAAALRASGAASSEVWIEEGWAGQPEISSRFMFFNQPIRSALSRREIEIHKKRLLAHTAWAAHGIQEAVRLDLEFGTRPSWQDTRAPSFVAKMPGLVADVDKGIWIKRRNPDWEYFVDGANYCSIAKLPVAARDALAHLFGFYRPSAVRSGDCFIVSAGGFNNCVPVSLVDRAVEIVRVVEGRAAFKWKGPEARVTEDSILMLPLESHCVFFGRRTMVSLATPCGLAQFSKARDTWQRESFELAAFFNSGTQWEWLTSPDPARMEELIEALLSEEPGLQWVRSAGPTFDRDQGRDHVAMWLTPPGLHREGHIRNNVPPPVRLRRVVVQVKTRTKSVSKADVTDVRDTVEHHSADGFLLIAYPGWTSGLFDYLEALSAKGIWVDCWGRSQLEERLRRTPYVAQRFPDLVRRVDASPTA